MNKILIYASKTGTTEKCAEKLVNGIKNLKKINISKEKIDINKYDLIIIGTPIRMGMINKNIKNFILNNVEILKQKQLAFFICCGFNENIETYYNQNIPKELLNSSIIHSSFGGEMNLEKQKGFDKIVTSMVSKNDNRKVELIEENIDKFIDVINSTDSRL